MSRRRSAPRRRLKARIFGSFGAIGLAGFLITLVLALTITRVYADFQRLTDISERVEVGGEVALQMVELQRLSGEFVQSGRSFPAEQTGIVFERARGLLEQLGEGRARRWATASSGWRNTSTVSARPSSRSSGFATARAG